LVAVEEVEAKTLARQSQCPGIDVDTQQPDKLIVLTEPLQQLAAATAKISHMSGATSEQGIDDSVQAGVMQSRCHQGGAELFVIARSEATWRSRNVCLIKHWIAAQCSR
jgi:hypothetical protein